MHVTKLINDTPTSIHGIGEYLNAPSHLGTMDIDVNAILAEKIYAALPFCSIDFIENISGLAVIVKITTVYKGKFIKVVREVHIDDILNAESLDKYFGFVVNGIVREVSSDIRRIENAER